MAGNSSFSLTEKLAVTGAFLALVAMGIGTEDDPGVVVAGSQSVAHMQPAAAPVSPPPQVAAASPSPPFGSSRPFQSTAAQPVPAAAPPPPIGIPQLPPLPEQ